MVLEVSESRLCHVCAKPRGVAHIDPVNHPGKLLCAECAGVADGVEYFKDLMVSLRNAIAAEGGFDRRMTLAKVDELIGKLEK